MRCWGRNLQSAWVSIVFSHLPLSCCAGFINTPVGEIVVYANDPRIVYNPPFDITSGIWDVQFVPGIERNASQTMDPNARISLVFQGSSLKLYALKIPGVSTSSLFDVKIDGTSTPVAHVDPDKNIRVVSFDESKVDSSMNHTVVVQKKEGSNSDSSWNFIALGFMEPSPTPLSSPPPIATISQLPDVSMTAGVSASPEDGGDSETLSRGAIAGIVVSILCGIGAAGALVLCLRRRKNVAVNVAPEPLMIEPSGRDRSRRAYSGQLPHYNTPTSVWPTSEVRSSMVGHPALANEKTMLRNFPSPSPLLDKPSPPRSRQPRFPRFFITNPSSHSSRSARSQSLKDSRIISDKAQNKDTNLDLLDSNDEKMEAGALERKEWDRVRMDNGKQKAVGFESDPTRPERPKMTRKQSLRRFFTTNPNPSTSSGSSSISSLRRSATAKTTAVTDYVRDQIRRQHKLHPGFSQIPVSAKGPAVVPRTIPETLPTGGPPAAPEPAIIPQVPKKTTRTSQTRFFTTNPSPSIPDSNTECESVLSEIPPPRKDKGKARAF